MYNLDDFYATYYFQINANSCNCVNLQLNAWCACIYVCWGVWSIVHINQDYDKPKPYASKPYFKSKRNSNHEYNTATWGFIIKYVWLLLNTWLNVLLQIALVSSYKHWISVAVSHMQCTGCAKSKATILNIQKSAAKKKEEEEKKKQKYYLEIPSNKESFFPKWVPTFQHFLDMQKT